MTVMHGHRGSAPVGFVAELGPVEAGAVLYLRRWYDGKDAQSKVSDDFTSLLGPSHGRTALNSLDQLCDLCARYGRRPLMRHQVSDECIGGDEGCFANFIAAASEGDRDDAMWIATMLVRADLAPSLVGLAQTLGLALKRMALKTAPPTLQPTTRFH